MEASEVDDEDDDLTLQRASSRLINELKRHVRVIVNIDVGRVTDKDHISKSCSAISRRMSILLDSFQEGPQLLDSRLKDLLPPLISTYLALINSSCEHQQNATATVLQTCIAKVLAAFCKVRGDKVVSRFLDNEARNIDAVLHALERIEAVAEDDQTWEQQYILLLWLAHLILTPFPLSTVSARSGAATFSENLNVPRNTPKIIGDSLVIALRCLASPTKKQRAAVTLLVRLALRPDMHAIGLLDALTQWVTQTLDNIDPVHDIHLYIGALRILAGLSSPAHATEVSAHLVRFYYLTKDLSDRDSGVMPAHQQSAVARYLSIKIQRNVITSVLRPDLETHKELTAACTALLDDHSALERVIDSLLRALADRDTPVRLAASKALSVITLKLEPVMTEEVVDAVLDSMREGMTSTATRISVQAVHPLFWHGLTLTLAHMLFRRSPSPKQLPSILTSLYTALAFEQRSTLGYAIGSNVRDAANFGLWSLARKYTSEELSSVSLDRAKLLPIGHLELDVFQTTACHLVVAACIDPVGNIRRGSSAALQELIGRHPNHVSEGIPLIQVIDYQAVGLRSRAMVEVSFEASKLGDSYRKSLIEGLLGWRGISTPDRAARENAASAIGLLSGQAPALERARLVSTCTSQIQSVPLAHVEERHGLILALAAFIRETIRLTLTNDGNVNENIRQANEHLLLWNSLHKRLNISEKDLKLASPRSALTATATLTLLDSLSQCSLLCKSKQERTLQVRNEEKDDFLDSPSDLFILCLKAIDADSTDLIQRACVNYLSLYDLRSRRGQVRTWLDTLSHVVRVSRHPGLIIALASAFTCILEEERSEFSENESLQRAIIDSLVAHNSPTQAIETRVIACRSIGVLVKSLPQTSISSLERLARCLYPCIINALQDYTTNERGDEGSLLRAVAVEVIDVCWQRSFRSTVLYDHQSRCAIYQLALEKLDKLRLQAAGVLLRHAQPPFDMRSPAQAFSLSDVSKYEYFHSLAITLEQDLVFEHSSSPQPLALAVMSGFASSTSPTSSALADTARSALVTALETLPVAVVSSEQSSLLSVLVNVQSLLSQAITSSDRLLTPALDMLAFLLDAGLIQRIQMTDAGHKDFKPRTLLSYVQKAHFKSTNISRLLSAIDCYRGLAELTSIQTEVLKKLKSMLMHPFPKVRMAVAETLWIVTANEELLMKRWASSALVDKAFVEGLRLEES